MPSPRSVARSSRIPSPRRRTYHHGDLPSALVDVTLRFVEAEGTEVHGFSMLVVDAIWEPPAERELDRMIAELGAAVLRSLR